ncbi:hypothetical protein ANN_11619 [Periplaneta americana]|uniref:Reverse transcriptase domain-containing protein n=1 Tax=Periplaneta americana TaxID=6978 RepID=A0ABQ8T5J3_PERAM|nr:hypothetical protein ANN_11619 [Periplaneta americana]
MSMEEWEKKNLKVLRNASLQMKALHLSDNTLSWMDSYLRDRQQCVSLDNQFSQWRCTKAGVPQGSVLGPLLFSIYINDVSKNLQYCRYHLYADDLQLYIHSRPNTINESIDKLNCDLATVSTWAANFGLALNPMQTLVTPHFDYCDVLLSDLSSELSVKLQRAQNMCVRYVCNIRRHEFKLNNYENHENKSCNPAYCHASPTESSRGGGEEHNRGALKYTTEYEKMASLLCFHGYQRIEHTCGIVRNEMYVLCNIQRLLKRREQHLILKHPEPMFLSQSESPSFTTIEKNRPQTCANEATFATMNCAVYTVNLYVSSAAAMTATAIKKEAIAYTVLFSPVRDWRRRFNFDNLREYIVVYCNAGNCINDDEEIERLSSLRSDFADTLVNHLSGSRLYT